MRNILIFSFMMVLGCTSVGVKTLDTKTLDLASYQTYNHLEFNYSHYDSIPYNENIYTYFIRQMDKHMEAKGLNLSDNPNLIINVGVAIRQEQQTRETDVRTDMHYMGQRRYHWESEEVVVGVYDVGDITIDFVDKQKSTLIWQASIEEMLSKNEDKMKKRIDKALEKLFEEFPAK